MNQLIPILASLLIAIPLLVFWMRMFQDMTNNDYLPASAKNYWLMVLVLLNIIGAIMYYINEYRYRH